ncbi:MAG TPA: ABC transporter permease [Steroidobacteraceae bacterium]|nr:ABC transporter permease [Steroidobacteraceae bacterium]
MTNVLALEGGDDVWRLNLKGDWSPQALPQIEQQLAILPATLAGDLTCDWSEAAAPGIGPTWALLARISAADRLSVRHVGGPPRHLQFLRDLQVGRSAGAAAQHTQPDGSGPVGKLGRWALWQGAEARAAVGFFGRIVAVIGEAFGKPRALRLSSLVRHIYETGVTAIPIVALIAFLVSVIVAYLGAQQLARFGADIFVVDLIAIAMLREMGVLLTAIIVAGRSGSAFAAEIGVMQLNEETDALRAMGLNPIELLVVPRLLALVIALPLLTVVADAMGLAGGALLSYWQLQIPWPQFASRLHEALAPTTFWAGLVKAPVFALLIGSVGAYRGMQVRDSARELGRLTTLAVVQSIFLVILADAIFAVVFVHLDF